MNYDIVTTQWIIDKMQDFETINLSQLSSYTGLGEKSLALVIDGCQEPSHNIKRTLYWYFYFLNLERQIEYKTENPLFLDVKTHALSYDKPDSYFFHIYLPFAYGQFENFKIGDLILFPGSPISEVKQIVAFYPAADMVVTMSPSDRRYVPGTVGTMRISDLRKFDIYFRYN